MLHRDRVTWVSRKAFGLSDGSVCQHPFELSDDWTVEQMQTIFDICNHRKATPTCLTAKKRRLPCFRPDIGESEVLRALEACNYKQVEAKELLGVNDGVLQHRIRKYKITHPRWTKHKPA